ncbi:MAG TPA: hypothetical protein PK760_14305, partial [Flavobacteriales bacterium]|nr:hypothetical protein [Flavobacteriales bacterium]
DNEDIFVLVAEKNLAVMVSVMNRVSWWGLVIFWIGFLFKFMHWPMASLNLLIGTALLVTGVFLKRRTAATIDLHSLSLRAVLAAAHLFLLFRLLYWPGSWITFMILLIALGGALMLFMRSDFVKPTTFLTFFLIGLLSASLVFVRAYSFSWFFGVGSPIMREEVPYSYTGWSQYSWFLHAAGEGEESMVAMNNAVLAAERCVAERDHDPKLIVFYKEERWRLHNNNWNEWRWPPDEYRWGSGTTDQTVPAR